MAEDFLYTDFEMIHLMPELKYLYNRYSYEQN